MKNEQSKLVTLKWLLFYDKYAKTVDNYNQKYTEYLYENRSKNRYSNYLIIYERITHNKMAHKNFF